MCLQEHITDIMHPRTYSIWETTPELLQQLRVPHHGCEAKFAMHAASSLYARPTDIEHGILSQLAQRTLAAQTDKALNYGCPLFARKFPVETADLVYKILTADHCHGLSILKPEVDSQSWLELLHLLSVVWHCWQAALCPAHSCQLSARQCSAS